MNQLIKCKTMRIGVVQDGSRGHYGLPIALHRAGILDRVYTDWFVRKGSLHERAAHFIEKLSPTVGRRMSDRRCPELDGVRFVTSLALRLRQQGRRRSFKDDGGAYFRWQSRSIGDWIIRNGLEGLDGLAGFIRNIHPHLCGVARNRGLKVVGDQMIAPSKVELQELQIQQSRWPGWEEFSADDYQRTSEFEAETWANLDAISCPSDYVKEGLVRCGVESGKVTVINYPIDEDAFAFRDRSGRGGPLIVGFVGSVGLRKGTPYFFEVARKFNPAHVRFVMIGASSIREEVLNERKGHVELLGGLPRSSIAAWMDKFDVFFFPSTCEGSAYALMEAMATGLPVVTSPNSGTVARQGVEGFLAPYDAVDTFVASIERLANDEELRLEMGRRARQRYLECGMDEYSRKWAMLFCSLKCRCILAQEDTESQS